MNSVKKGDDFELRTYHILRKLLDNNGLEIQLKGQNEFWTVPSSAHIKQKDKKKFPWGDSVINDLTIEGVEKQNDFLILIECKDYGHPVDRGDIAEFNTRIQDLKATKGIFITTNRFQAGAINMAQYHNIALIRVDINDTIIWDLHRIGNRHGMKYLEACEKLCSETLPTTVIALDGADIYSSLSDYFCCILDIIPGPISQYVPYLTNQQIQQSAKDFLCGKDYVMIPDCILMFYIIKNNIAFDYNADCGEFIGKYSFMENKIYVSRLITDEHRKRFTIAHEIGHAILHRKLLKDYISIAQDYDIECLTGRAKWEIRIETQANIFASYLLMPHIPFINYAMEIKSKLDIPLCCPFYLDNQECNIKTCDTAIKEIANFFKVSYIAVKMRLLAEKLLIER